MASYSNFIPPILFLSFWLFFCYWLSEMSGWRYLAQKYPQQASFYGEKVYFQTLGMQQAEMPTINRGSYRSCITIGLNQTGLSLRVLPFFRFAHRPIYIPWEDVTIQMIINPFFRQITFVKISFARSDITVYISQALAEKISQASNLPILPAAS